MSYNPTDRAFEVLTQVGIPTVEAPVNVPSVPGDVVIVTSDGTGNTPTQSAWEFTSAGQWVQTAGSVLGAGIPTPGIRNYYPTNSVIQERWTTAAQVSAAAISAMGFTPVGPSTSTAATAYAAGGLFGGRAMLQFDAVRTINGASVAAGDPDIFTIPTSYIRHEIKITPSVDNTYFLETLLDRVTTMEVWICNPTTGVPELRLNGKSISGLGAGRNVSLQPSPFGESASGWAYGEWFGYNIPKAVLASRTTVANTVKLAIRPGLFNPGVNRLFIAGFAMSVSSIGITTANSYEIDNRVNGAGFLNVAANLDGLAYIPITAGPGPKGTAGDRIRVALIDTTRDIWLSLMGHGNLNGDPTNFIEVSLKHASGDVLLGRPRPSLQSPWAVAAMSDIGNGHPIAGFVIPAAMLAAKSVKPANSAIPYLELNLNNVDTGGQIAYFSGIVTETLT
jgi:hypothetical protein